MSAALRPPITMTMTLEQRVQILKALSDPRRMELIEQLSRAACPLGCTDMRESLKIAPATLSHHIKELETAGLIRVERHGKFGFISLRPEIFAQLGSEFGMLAQLAIRDAKLPIEAPEPETETTPEPAQ